MSVGVEKKEKKRWPQENVNKNVIYCCTIEVAFSNSVGFFLWLWRKKGGGEEEGEGDKS